MGLIYIYIYIYTYIYIYIYIQEHEMLLCIMGSMGTQKHEMGTPSYGIDISEGT